MTTTHKDWKKEFGLDSQTTPHFYTTIEQLDRESTKVPHSHALRRAFKELHIDGVLCSERNPVIYFRQVSSLEPAEIYSLHRSFWNQGIAPVLVIIAPDEVHIYSGLTPPKDSTSKEEHSPGLVEILQRVEDQLKPFLLSVETGEYFHQHKPSFNPATRVDRKLLDNLSAARRQLDEIQAAPIKKEALDALLCRMVFTCYLFDRGIIGKSYLKELGIDDAQHLTDILSRKSPIVAKTELYKLFEKLGTDFNGDLFTVDLESESRHITSSHLEILQQFFSGAEIRTGQQSLWPYDFSFIPIETISAIYEHFLKAAGVEKKKEAGAFYTPRFLAEFVIDMALEGETTLLDKRFLDPACGSGIFLVGLFNRLAQEWNLNNPDARYDKRAKGLINILGTNIFGVDSNPSACKITAFSLYLAFLDQLSPPDIQRLLGKWERLPHLVASPDSNNNTKYQVIRCADFFSDAAQLSKKVNYIIGNPPWGPVKNRKGPIDSERWCKERKLLHPNREMSVPFIWKAPEHLEDGGKVCFILPHGILFNHNDTAVRFQKSLLRAHTIDRVVNMADQRFFLFEESLAPALMIRYRSEKPESGSHFIDYWAPKTDWSVRQAEIVSILPEDRSRIKLRDVLIDLESDDAPQIWKKRYWATPRDWRLLERLSLLPRLRDIIGKTGQSTPKRWIIAEGFQPLGRNDDPQKSKRIDLPSRLFVEAKSKYLDLILPGSACKLLETNRVSVRQRSNRNVSIFKAPHVLVTKGFSRIAFADFDVSFRHALRGIHGPESDRNLLIFLAAYLRSDIAKFFLFHTSSNWGIYRPEVHVEELLRIPFPLPDVMSDPTLCRAIVDEIAANVTKASKEASGLFSDRQDIVNRTQQDANKLIEEYFDIDDYERMLIADTITITIPSVQPTRSKTDIPSIKQSTSQMRKTYTDLLCNRLNSWSRSEYLVHGKVIADLKTGLGLVILQKTKRGDLPTSLPSDDKNLIPLLYKLRSIAAKQHGTFELVRGLKLFHKNLLYITKPLGQRFWCNTAALNDADEIAASILTRSPGQISR
ncbi:putative type I restriction-modification system, M subunit [Chitinispirillum alkaliphilum]|nr:putative type I restriction-modification system, M subunit [Chitinispirillum alkaliphilum]